MMFGRRSQRAPSPSLADIEAPTSRHSQGPARARGPLRFAPPGQVNNGLYKRNQFIIGGAPET